MLGILVCFGGGCGGPQYDTPEATFQTAKSAAERLDCRVFCQCLTDEAKDEMAAGLVMVGRFAEVAARIGAPNLEKAQLRAARFAEVLEDHGFAVGAAPKLTLNFGASEEEQRREMIKLVEPIKDRTAFIAASLRVLIDTADKPDEKLVEPDARLVDLKIDNDTATATFAQTREGKETTSPIKFKRVDGKWKISKLPRLMS